MEVKISPSILSADFSNLEREVKKVEASGADSLHLDVMDGRFVPNLTFGPMVIKSIRDKTSLPFIGHLMIENPEHLLAEFAEAGCDTIVVHVEACKNLEQTINQIKKLGVGTGVALNPATPVQSVEQVVDDIDELLIMTVNPGFGGQKFIPETLGKISIARAMVDKSRKKNLDIAVDGGINPQTCRQVIEAGANVLVAGSFVFDNAVEKAISELRTKCAVR